MLTGPFRCAQASAEEREPLAGTASRIRRWIAVEQPGPWGRDAILECRMDPHAARALEAHCRRHGVRLLLVRRPGWHTTRGPTTAFVASTSPTGSWIERLQFTDCNDLTRLDLTALKCLEPPGLGEKGPTSLHLVCTNGRHDPCCAEQGRPVARALVEAGIPEVWESSHVGGDRFAANIVCLPSGAYFGRVTPEGAPQLLTDFADGLLDLAHYRGRSCFPPMVQAAESLARGHWNERRLDAVVLEGFHHHGDEATVVLRRGEDEFVTVRLRRERGEARNLTCHAEEPAAPWQYLLTSLREDVR